MVHGFPDPAGEGTGLRPPGDPLMWGRPRAGRRGEEAAAEEAAWEARLAARAQQAHDWHGQGWAQPGVPWQAFSAGAADEPMRVLVPSVSEWAWYCTGRREAEAQGQSQFKVRVRRGRRAASGQQTRAF